jgi:hypothetical protein
MSFFPLCLATLRIRRELLDLCRHYFGPHRVAANHESARIDGKMGVFASGKLEKGGSDSNTETFRRDPAG